MLNLIHTEEADQAVSAPATIDAGQVRTDGGTQMRAQLDLETVEEYRQAMKEADGWGSFPALVVFYDGETHWLGDGFHRHAAYQSLPFDDPTPADIRAGTRQDAILHAAGANAKHGLRRTHADKRRAVETLLASDEWATWSDRQIARACNVSPTFVGKIRSAQPPAGEASEAVNEEGHTVHVDSMKSERTFVHPKSGKQTTMNTTNIGKSAEGDKHEDEIFQERHHELTGGAGEIRLRVRKSPDEHNEYECAVSFRIIGSNGISTPFRAGGRSENAIAGDTPRDALLAGAAYLQKELENDATNRNIADAHKTRVMQLLRWMKNQGLLGIDYKLPQLTQRDALTKTIPDPDTLPEWAAPDNELPPPSTAPDSLTITIDADTASALILAYDKNRIPREIQGIDEFINDLTDACNRQIHQPQAESPTPLPPVDMDWRSGWDQADTDEYSPLDEGWDIHEVTRPRVAMRMAEEETDPELARLLYSKLEELTGEPDV